MSARAGHPGRRQEPVEASFGEEQILGDHGIAGEVAPGLTPLEPLRLEPNTGTLLDERSDAVDTLKIYWQAFLTGRPRGC